MQPKKQPPYQPATPYDHQRPQDGGYYQQPQSYAPTSTQQPMYHQPQAAQPQQASQQQQYYQTPIAAATNPTVTPFKFYETGHSTSSFLPLQPTPTPPAYFNCVTSWISAFGTGGLADEPPLLEELDINLNHILRKTIAVLNPFRTTLDQELRDDTDLIGPLLFCLLFGLGLLLSGKVHFGYIYGVAIVGWLSMYGILNMMSENGIDMLRTASILGYCLLPMVILSSLSILFPLDHGVWGFLLGTASVLWCTISASNMFVSSLHMREQRLLVAYPAGLFYFCFALMTVF